MAQISITFRGDIAPQSKISLRNLGTFSNHLQLALNRVYLDVRFGKLEKYSRISPAEYSQFEYWLTGTREGSVIIDFLSTTEFGIKVSERFADILEPVYKLVSNGAVKESHQKKEYAERMKAKLNAGQYEPQPYSQMLLFPPIGFTNNYTEKSTLRNISTALAPLRMKGITDGEIEISVESPQKRTVFNFTTKISHAFHRFVSHRMYLEPAIYHAELYEMDSDKNTGMFNNLDNGSKQQRIIFTSEIEFEIARSFFRKSADFYFYGMPCVESGSLDLNAGDVLFVGAKDDNQNK